jgi:hypothetical protein
MVALLHRSEEGIHVDVQNHAPLYRLPDLLSRHLSFSAGCALNRQSAHSK